MTDLDKTQDAGTGFSRLESLSISGFRGIDQLTIPRLGRVTLIAGKNGVGKTTVLDAIRVYAAGGQISALRQLLTDREELTMYRDEDGDVVDVPEFNRLFHSNGDANTAITIGPIGDGPVLKIANDVEDGEKSLRVEFDGTERIYPEPQPRITRSRDGKIWSWQFSISTEPNPILCESLGPGLLNNDDLARLWDQIALTDDEEHARDALRLVFGDRVERAAVIGQGRREDRRVVVRISDHANPLPLKSLGDGATRMFGIALALVNCRDGILLIDEAENGIHYSLQSSFWSMVLQAAEAHNTQVLATTHSKDCINGFATAALAHPEVEGNLVRIGWRRGELRAVEYSKEQLEVAAEQNIEVR